MKTPMPTSACGRGALVFESLREFWATTPLGSAKSLEHQSLGVEHSRTGSLGCEVSIGYGVVVLGNPCRELQAGIGLTAETSKLVELWLLSSLEENVRGRMEVSPGEEGWEVSTWAAWWFQELTSLWCLHPGSAP